MSPKAHRLENRQDMNTDSYEIFHNRNAYIREIALHHHDFYEVYFFLSGDLEYIIENRSYPLSPGDVLLISPTEFHQPLFRGDQHSYERFVLWINPRFLELISPRAVPLSACFEAAARNHTHLLRPGRSEQQALTHLMDRLKEESESDDIYSDYCAMSYLAQILTLLNRLSRSSAPHAPGKQATETVVFDVLDHINRHYSEELSLDELARRFFISKFHLSREFQRQVGTSVHRYLTRKRLAMARQFMSDGLSPSDASQRCGFGDYSSFYRAFRAEYQCSPRDFTDNLQKSAAAARSLRPPQLPEL